MFTTIRSKLARAAVTARFVRSQLILEARELGAAITQAIVERAMERTFGAAGVMPSNEPGPFNPAPGRTRALAWLEREFQMRVVSSLPRDEEGAIIWDLAGPMMFRELPAIKFAVLYLTTVPEEHAEDVAKRVLNEWHGLQPDAGHDAPYSPDDLVEGVDP